MMQSKRHYCDGPYGQIHYMRWADPDGKKPVLLCMAPSPVSGKAYSTIAPLLTERYDVIAFDYPGYGQSDRPSEPITISVFAKAALGVLQSLELGSRAVYATGFHTGCLVCVEASLMAPETFEKLILIDAPFFSAEKQALLKEQNIGKITLSEDMSSIASVWKSCVEKRIATVGLERAFEIFMDQLSSGENAGDAFAAAFQYDCFARAKNVTTPTTVIATKAGLYDESVAAHKAIPTSKLVEVGDVSVSVLDQAAAKIAPYVLAQSQ